MGISAHTPDFQAFLNDGPKPTFNDQPLRAQADAALTNAEYGGLFSN